jgi:uncharacterized protein (DUF58 family)
MSVLGSVTQRLGILGANWAERRQGRDRSEGFQLQRRRIYILPTRYGAIFAVVLFAMLLGSINYGANLAYALTFLLTGLVLVILHHCHNNLLRLELRFAGAEPVFANQSAEFRIAIHNPAGVVRQEIEVAPPDSSAPPVDIEPQQTQIVGIRFAAGKRGWLRIGRFRVTTAFPASLFRAWTWVHMDAHCLVYPSPAPSGRPLPDIAAGSSRRASFEREDADFYGLRNASESDSPNRIAWKAYARNDQLLTKQFAGAEHQPCMLDWDAVPSSDVEFKLSQLTRWCLDAAAQSRAFALRIPGRVIPLGSGSKHMHECLCALALFEAAAT